MNVETARKAKGFIGAATKTVIKYNTVLYCCLRGWLKKKKKKKGGGGEQKQTKTKNQTVYIINNYLNLLD